jgi:serine phosphatase RsbU (regulator of sigma subunit)
MKFKLEKNFVYLALVVCAVILGLLFYNLSNTVDSIAKTLLEEKVSKTKRQLNNFFSPVVDNLEVACERGLNEMYDSISLKNFNLGFIPLIKQSAQISSLLYASSGGNEFLLLEMDSTWINRVTHDGSEFSNSEQYEWSYQNNELQLVKTWQKEERYDPRSRPWYIGASENYPVSNWTDPYTFFTTKDPGITISKMWLNENGDSSVLAFDLLLTDISQFTINTEVTENGGVFIFMNDNRILGLPKEERYDNLDSIKSDILKPLEDLNNSLVNNFVKNWNLQEDKEISFSFSHNGEAYRGNIDLYKLGGNTFHIAVFAPEKDFMSEVKYTKWVIIFGFVLIFVFALILIFAYKRKEKDNVVLKNQKELIQNQKQEVVEKNKEITDSINYAKRIQVAILPPEKLIKQFLPDSFVLYKPKDIVAGDFYWMEKVEDLIVFAAADCTGHGVPGAMVSVVCHNALNRSVREFSLIEPGEILDKTRELVIKQFEKSEEEVKDGMDIALCVLNVRSRELKYAGANNPLWIVKPEMEELFEIKGDKQPIGKYAEIKEFSTHKLNLNKGDLIFLFTDGFADQFGGPKGKKFKYKTFKNLLLKNKDLSVREQLAIYDESFEDWKGDLEQLDDVCVIGVRV